MSNSSLVNYTRLSPNHSNGRNHAIDTITIHCLPVNRTELLTKKGWKKLGDIEVGDVIATSDEYCNITFDKVLNVVPIHQDEVYNFSTGFSGTKDHRILVKKQYEIKKDVPYNIYTVNDLLSKKSSDYLPNCGIYNSEGIDLTDDEINFLCAIQADGCYEKYEDNVTSVYFRFWKTRKIEEFEKLLSILKYDCIKKEIYGTKNYEKGMLYRINIKDISKYDKYLTDKTFNFNLLEMTTAQANIFIDSLVKWDGCFIKKGEYIEKRYVSKLQQNIDLVTAIASTNNIGFRIDNNMTITFKEKTYRSYGRIDKVEKTIEDVSCVSVPSGLILIRQNGRATICGNCMAGNLTVETCGAVFAPTSRQASSNYGVGTDGRVGMYVEEKNRAWTSSNSANDNRAVTIEVANDGGAPDWHVSNTALNKTIELVADICRRNGIKKLVWSNNKQDRINHRNGCNMTVHRDFASTACPGDYLYSKQEYIASEVNKKLGAKTETKTDTKKEETETVTVLRKGSKGKEVEVLQTNLNKAINAGLAVDGDFGSKTEKAVKDFQKKYGLVVDGIYGPKSQAKMQEVTSAKGGEVALYKFNYTMNIRKGPGTDFAVVGTMTAGTYTIIRQETNNGSTWGKLKSGAGWVCIKGSKVYGVKR